ncbi:histidinol-phosphate transaminase [Corynebacterium sp. sy039]|uniref:histidinol-phosphate transaminase n=1 Tax=Corynebacterium sp. sy039 TaxID=2599641 RepID=UPI0011B3A94A|nr:histidinol-phosphate transaminase [Corynebacterium sp. sy039]QDZ42890.1 histidinol-phosphate transaminase [Corynebacterium sp. sy039]
MEQEEYNATGSISVADLAIRDDLRGKQAYGAPQLNVRVRLNTNENPYPPSDALIEELAHRVARQAHELNRYPDRDCVELRQELAAYVTKQTGYSVTKDNLWAANGSNEILMQLFQAFGGPGRKALGFSPSYSMHPILATGAYTEFIDCPRDEHFDIDMRAAHDAIVEHKPHIIFITTPNNPTGNSTSLEDIEHIVQLAPGIVIIDEAYAEFSQQPSAVVLLKKYPHKVVVSRTMSKAFDFAGARLGYCVADPAFIEALMLVRLPYHLSAISQVSAIVALQHSDDTLATVEMLVQERERVAGQLAAMGFYVLPSQANFLFFGLFDDQAQAWQAFLEEQVLIRDVGITGFLRVTIGTPEENDAFLAAAKNVLKVANIDCARRQGE